MTQRTSKVKISVDAKEILEYMARMIFKIENPIWQRIVRISTKYDRNSTPYPAAKTNHHAFETGLAYHNATICSFGEAIARYLSSAQ